MQLADVSPMEAMDNLLNELDRYARSDPDGNRRTSRMGNGRRHPRHPFRVACRIRFFSAGSQDAAELNGRTRNLSCGGLGFVVRRMFAADEPVEIRLEVPDRGVVYMAGLVRFCRYVGLSHHEVGMELKAVGGAPILPNGPEAMERMLQWLDHA